MLATSLLPLTAGAASAADTPTLAQCNAYRAADKAATASGKDLLAKQAARDEAAATLTDLIAGGGSEAQVTVARSAATKAGDAAGKAYTNDVQARGLLANTLEAIGGDADVCADIVGPGPTNPGPSGPGPTNPGTTGPGATGEGTTENECGCDDEGGSSGSGGDQVAGARIEPEETSTATSTVPAVDTSTATGDSGITQVSDVPSGAVEAGDGSTEGNHIGEALAGLGALGLTGAATAGAVVFRRREPV